MDPWWKVKQVQPPADMTGSCWCTAGKGIKTKWDSKKRIGICLSYGLLSDGMESQDPAGSEQVACTEGESRSLSGDSLNCDSIEKIIYSSELRLIIEEERWSRGKGSPLGYRRGKFAGERGSLKGSRNHWQGGANSWVAIKKTHGQTTLKSCAVEQLKSCWALIR